ncbi:TetR/AcrR family transcriptional regulator [Sphaerisporangium sp. B11E5]|uniref:TetR/AcrR family transcriptional regulator n=1 Tax=Sphaerisporangium sp. B11E5 TaxID=3153563 RepID=UPI00325D1118
MDAVEPVRRGRGRRPAGEVRREVLRAAGELLLEQGVAGFTIEKVATRAGASRVTLYKWWPSKGALALDGFSTMVAAPLAFPDTGEIGTDLTGQLLDFVRLVRDTPAGRVMAELICHAQSDPDLAVALRERYTWPRTSMAVEVLDRAKERGQIRSDVDSEDVVAQLWGACYFQLLVFDRPLTDQFARSIIVNLLGGIRA